MGQKGQGWFSGRPSEGFGNSSKLVDGFRLLSNAGADAIAARIAAADDDKVSLRSIDFKN